MRDLSTEELGHVYGAGDVCNGHPAPPKKHKCKDTKPSCKKSSKHSCKKSSKHSYSCKVKAPY